MPTAIQRQRAQGTLRLGCTDKQSEEIGLVPFFVWLAFVWSYEVVLKETGETHCGD
jgi:hypothetical protein